MEVVTSFAKARSPPWSLLCIDVKNAFDRTLPKFIHDCGLPNQRVAKVFSRSSFSTEFLDHVVEVMHRELPMESANVPDNLLRMFNFFVGNRFLVTWCFWWWN